MNSKDQEDEQRLTAPLLQTNQADSNLSLKQAALLRQYRRHKVCDTGVEDEDQKFEALSKEETKSPIHKSQLEEHKVIREITSVEYFDPHRNSFEQGHPAKKHYIKRELVIEEGDGPVIVVPRARNVPLTPVREVESPVAQGVVNYRGQPYVDPWAQEEEIMTDNQTVVYILMNFGLAFLLVTAVNNNSATDQCAYTLKQWIIVFALILATNSLCTIYGIDIQRKPIFQRKAHQVLKVLVYIVTVGWLLRGIDLYSIDGITCRQQAPWLCFTMLTTLLLGSIQLILFFGLVVGLIMWLLSKMFGFQVNFTPESLWRDQQQFIDQDPVYAINEENKKILSELEEREFESYRIEVRADILYGFKEGDPNVWRDPDLPSQIRSTADLDDRNDVGLIECAICMENFDAHDIVSPLPCHMNHLFHTSCIRPWLLRNKSCPLCKLEFQEHNMRSASQSFMLNNSSDSSSNTASDRFMSNSRASSQRRPRSKY